MSMCSDAMANLLSIVKIDTTHMNKIAELEIGV